MVILFQKLESAAIVIAVLVAYHLLAYSWLWFFLLILVPDIFMLGYVKNPRVGAIVYNIGHSYFFPIGLWGAGYVLEIPFVFTLSLIWAAHIAIDRMVGYGLKLPEGFKHTHLSR